MAAERSERRRGGLTALAVAITAGTLTLGMAPAATAQPAPSSASVRSAAVHSTAVPMRQAPVKIVAYPNCAALNKVYKHGVGKKGAVDKVRGRVTAKGVKNFFVNNALYAKNIKRDGDKDGVACEKK